MSNWADITSFAEQLGNEKRERRNAINRNVYLRNVQEGKALAEFEKKQQENIKKGFTFTGILQKSKNGMPKSSQFFIGGKEKSFTEFQKAGFLPAIEKQLLESAKIKLEVEEKKKQEIEQKAFEEEVESYALGETKTAEKKQPTFWQRVLRKVGSGLNMRVMSILNNSFCDNFRIQANNNDRTKDEEIKKEVTDLLLLEQALFQSHH